MRLSDRIAGPMVALFGLAVIWAARALPAIPGVRFGPSLMPVMIGTCLVVLGLVIAVSAFTGKARHDAPLFDASDWFVPARQKIATIWCLAGPVVGIAVFDSVGFPLFAVVYVAGLMTLMGARWPVVVIAAPLLALALYLGFSKGLRVPLTAGWLAGILP